MNSKYMKKKRYAVYGLMEFMLRLPTPTGGVDIHFTGGQMSGYGVIPSHYETSDPILIRMIEATPEFKTGKITVL